MLPRGVGNQPDTLVLVWPCLTEGTWHGRPQCEGLWNNQSKWHRFMEGNSSPERGRKSEVTGELASKLILEFKSPNLNLEFIPLNILVKKGNSQIGGCALSRSLWTHLLPKSGFSIFTVAKLLALGRGMCLWSEWKFTLPDCQCYTQNFLLWQNKEVAVF